MRRASLCVLCFLAAAALFASRATVNVVNDSDWDIYHFLLTPADEDDWGEDQLGDEIIEANGGRFQLHDVPCDTYDVMLVDEDGDECVVPEVDICKNSQKWVITNEELLDCQGWGR